eukprot:TRINITY_DN2242_c0_g1_i1.p1 TRINITY_DN2242_c0_g1~~TRINITY_DN2242_c0_g1_i1.p1  ORF type:complete len:131 (+),score=56.66 TRINITY_DN2242_c0_g1_i1:62-454(+)
MPKAGPKKSKSTKEESMDTSEESWTVPTPSIASFSKKSVHSQYQSLETRSVTSVFTKASRVSRKKESTPIPVFDTIPVQKKIKKKVITKKMKKKAIKGFEKAEAREDKLEKRFLKNVMKRETKNRWKNLY